MSQKPPPNRPDPADPADPARPDEPGPPQQSAEDTDRGWGEPRDPDEDERLRRDRPPHWDDS
jgi:hypothetical protein